VAYEAATEHGFVSASREINTHIHNKINAWWKDLRKSLQKDILLAAYEVLEKRAMAEMNGTNEGDDNV
jgi:hypothetical protein